MGVSVNEKLFASDGDRFCPACLKEEDYWRRSWSINPLAACERHGCLLLDRCNTCGRKLSLGRARLVVCGFCGCYLTSMKAEKVNPIHVIYFSQLISRGDQEAATKIFDFWDALSQCDELGDSQKILFDRLSLAVEWQIGVDNTDDIAQIIFKNQKNIHPRLRIVPFLKKGGYLADFAERVINKINFSTSSYEHTTSLDQVTLSKKDVSFALGISLCKLKTLIRHKRIIWPSRGDRSVKIPAHQIAVYLSELESGSSIVPDNHIAYSTEEESEWIPRCQDSCRVI